VRTARWVGNSDPLHHATDAAENGISLADDAKTLAAAEAFFEYFRSTFMPIVEKLYGELKAM
jgi:hypothetical protein